MYRKLTAFDRRSHGCMESGQKLTNGPMDVRIVDKRGLKDLRPHKSLSSGRAENLRKVPLTQGKLTEGSVDARNVEGR